MIALPIQDFASIDVNAFRELLREQLAVFCEIDQALQTRVVDYLITGHDVEVLLDLRDALRSPNRRRFFRTESGVLKPVDIAQGCRLLKLFGLTITPDRYYQRLGHVCSQCADMDSVGLAPDEHLPKWFNDLVRFAFVLTHDGSPTNSANSKIDARWTCPSGPMLASLEGNDVDHVLRNLLAYYGSKARSIGAALRYFGGLNGFLEQQLDRVIAIVRSDTALRGAALEMLEDYMVKLREHLAEVIDYRLVTSSGRPSVFQAILELHKTDARQVLLDRLKSGSTQQRSRSVQWLHKLYGEEIVPELVAALEHEADPKVRAAIHKLCAPYLEASEYQRALATSLSLPSIDMPTGVLPLPAGFTVKFQAFLDRALARSLKQTKRDVPTNAPSELGVLQSQQDAPIQPSPDELLALYLFMEGESTTKPPTQKWLFQVLLEEPDIQQWCEPQRLHLLHVMRLLDAIGSLQERSSALKVFHIELLLAHRRYQSVAYGLREMDAAAQAVIGRPHLMSRAYLMDGADYQLDATDTWPAFVDQLELLENSIAGVPLDQFDRDVTNRRRTALHIAAMLPVLPKQLEDAAWEVALNEAWTLRPLARPLLKCQPKCLQRAITALADRRAGARMGAAELLQELGSEEAIEPLKKALKKEKLRPVQGHLLAALETLNANVDEFIGREKLLLDAEKGVKRPPRSMMWFPMDALPVVRWACDNQALPPVVIKWWLIQCVEFKSTTCSPIMRRALALCRRDDTLRLAHFILDSWIKFDTDEPDHCELVARFQAQAESFVDSFPMFGQNKREIDEYVDHLVKEEIRALQRQQSTHSERGMLAIVAAFGDASCVEMIEKYIRTYHGNRTLQAKSLLEVIPQIDAPNSLRVLCSLAAGFRNAAIARRAAELFREKAQAFGWSKDEVAERIIPDAGFAISQSIAPSFEQQAPEMLLNYGPRSFRVIVDEQFQVSVLLEDGTRARDLPAAQKTDDKTLVRVAKAHLKSSREVLRTVEEHLTQRLHQAMMDRREWNVTTWRECLASHALAGIACRRLVWSVRSPTSDPLTYFQLLADGSVVDAHGQQLSLPEDWLISVARADQMERSVEQSWIDHLASKSVTTLFPQLSKAHCPQGNPHQPKGASPG